jgi:glycosyltransferase involved in cell wall biosynthesis
MEVYTSVFQLNNGELIPLSSVEAKIIDENDIDIIHLHSGKDYWLGTLSSMLAGKGKIIATRHILKPLGQSYIHRKIYNQIDQFIAVSDHVQQVLIEENNICDQKVDVVYNGVDINKFHLSNFPSNLKKNLNLFIQLKQVPRIFSMEEFSPLIIF